jgi:creatinine amidohydrolase/Fe(II)-dependent formamide hydrolase-like protein
VLSSGGKDSLLTFGLLRELGKEPHPIFVNEAGRHWYTALNAYRAFRRTVPQTARVWTNSDRVFAWMLRQLPLVRPDFHTLRADMYPLRLWTVAVFLFGALPLLRKRQLGVLLIGDEYDSTVRTRHQGISHYDGLFDQSAYFDTALTSYFFDKGWRVAQFSVLRPLSELLIEKTLAERYPDLLRLQVSCHATHLDKDLVRPCGRCEKCRRIVGMLLGLDQDPTACGYTPEQIDAIKPQLVQHGVHQERPAAEHLAMLLHERGHLEQPRLGEVTAQARPQALQLRFHPRRSPWTLCPLDLRSPLFRLLNEHAQGAVDVTTRGGGTPVQLLEDPRARAEGVIDRLWAASGPAAGKGSDHVWGELTWPKAKQRLAKVDVALLPVGAVEQHGPHLPLDTDAFDADYLVKAVADRCTDPKPFVLPLIAYGVSYHHDDFAGTLSVGNQALSAYVYDVGMNLARNGIKKLIIVNGHGGNSPALHYAAQMVNRDARIFTCVETGETSDTDVEGMIETHNDAHAGEIETSTSLALRPELVDMSAAKPFVPRFQTQYLDYSHQRSVGWYARTAKISRNGVLGDPTRASRAKGERIWEIMIARLADFVEHVKETPLERLYQPRY